MPRSIRPFAARAARSCVALLAVVLLALLAPPVPAGDSADATAWPRQFDSDSGSFVLYEPQPEELDGDLLTARAAFSLQKSEKDNPQYGVLWFSAHVLIDRDSSTVAMRDFDVTRVRLPGITRTEANTYEHLVEAEAVHWDLSGSFEELQTGLAAAERERESVADIDNAPPRILFSQERAILVVYDGDPLTESIEGTDLERVSNTPYAVVYEPASHEYFLNGANLWYMATDPLGPWSAIPQAPPAVRAVVPPDTSAEDQVLDRPPRILTATEPTELIATDGPPNWAPLGGGGLLYVTNTESDVFRDVGSQSLYVLIAGRWFRADSLDGPWTFARSDSLPDAFRQIALDSPKANVLASIAGTDQADDAVADAEIAQTSAIDRSRADVDVSYDGDPQFEPIEGTDLYYAVNTDAEVLREVDRYYLVDQGVWYISDSPLGPWRVSDTRPLDVDEIPPSSPVYDVRYVTIFSVTDDAIYEGYYPGYLGCYPYYGTVVYGTGHRYHAWRGHHHYYPRPSTWGFHARYNPWLGRWSFGYSFGAGFLRTGTRWRPNLPPGKPAHHTPSSWFGAGGYHRPFIASDLSFLRTRPPGRYRPQLPGRELTNLYTRPANAPRVNQVALRLPRPAPARPVVRPIGKPNDSFAGRDGRVYRRQPSGNWQVNQGGLWRPTPTPAAPPPGRIAVPTRITPVPPPAPAQAASTRPGARTPSPSRTPPSGDLESAFRARERARDGIFAPLAPRPARPAPPPAPPAPRPAPAVPPTVRPVSPPQPPQPTPTPPPAPPKRDDDRDRGGGGR
jgi:hypothetical protein